MSIGCGILLNYCNQEVNAYFTLNASVHVVRLVR